MNCRYFACPTDKTFIDAGYRWAYWTLEHNGIVKLGEAVDIQKILKEEKYWNPTDKDESDWLCGRVLPSVREFLKSRLNAEIIYVDEDFICQKEELGDDWKEISSEPLH